MLSHFRKINYNEKKDSWPSPFTDIIYNPMFPSFYFLLHILKYISSIIFIRVGMPKNFDCLNNESNTEVGDES